VNDADLIERSLVDGRLFEPLFDRHYRAIHRYFNARAGVAAADDLASETFTIAFRRRGSYDLSRTDAAPWLYGIALNLLRGHRRSEENRHRTHARVAASANDHQDGSAEVFDKNGGVSLALLDLDEQDRDLIILFAWAELSYEQRGAAFGLPVGTVRSRLSRIRARMRESLSVPESEGTVADGTPER
jgi:RNA polymerase sigma-70 factor (ECF subfamily)